MVKPHSFKFIIILVLYWIPGCGFVYAQNSLSCDESSPSVYCDDSWSGMHIFTQTLAHQASRLTLYTNLEDEIHPNHVSVWISPDSVHIEHIQQALHQGARLIVFDRGNTSAEWFNALFLSDASAADTPEMKEAAHINNNPALPVLKPAQEWIDNFSLNESSIHQIAFNHPRPLKLGDKYILLYHMPRNLQGLSPSDGMLIVLRDESLPTNLMMQTLDNRIFIESIIGKACEGRRPCPIDIYEPKFKINASFGAPLPDTPSIWQSMTQKVLETRRKAEKYLETHEAQISAAPWRWIALAVVALWAVLIIWVVLPFSRIRYK